MKEWEEFRASYASVFLLLWIHKDLEDIAPDYLDRLRDRIWSGLDTADGLNEDDPERDDEVPISDFDADYHGITWFSRNEAELLLDQLFPHSGASEEHVYAGRALVAVGLHGALEAYARSLGAFAVGRLPEAVRAYLAQRQLPLDADLYKVLVDLDETRHLWTHNRGIVTERYVNNVPYNALLVGERRVVALGDAWRFADATWQVGVALRTAAALAT